MFSHLLLLVLAAAVIWLFSGQLIDAVDRVAQRFDKPGFTVAFFVLGILTSISEISVAVNATITGVPEVSAGNLMGASLVIFLVIIPFLAVLGGGIPLLHSMRLTNLALLLFIVMVPAVLGLDGMFIRTEGLVMLLLYVALLYRLQKKQRAEDTAAEAIHETEEELLHVRHATWMDIGKIALGAVCIFLAGNLLVRESVAIATILGIPLSYVGLLLLAVGTNVPELVIGIRSVLRGRHDIAFGDYLGSAAANTLVFSFMVTANGAFAIDFREVLVTFIAFTIGLTLFFLFSRSNKHVSRKEGWWLLALYGLFVIIQIFNAAQEAGEGKLKSAAPDELRMEN